MSASDLTADERAHSLDFDAQLKSTLIRLCRELGIPHRGLKSQLMTCLLAYRGRLPPPLAPAAASSSVSPISAAPTSTATMLTTAPGQAPAHDPQITARLLHAQLPPLPAHLTSLVTDAANSSTTQPLPATVGPHQTVFTTTATVPELTSRPSQTSSSTQVHDFLPPARTAIAALGLCQSPVYDIQQIALQVAQQAARDAVSRVLSLQASTQSSTSLTVCLPPPAPPVTLPPAPPPSRYPPYVSGATPTWVYQLPTILPHQYATTSPAAPQLLPPPQPSQTVTATPSITALPPAPAVTLPQFAPLSGTIPTIPSKFATAAAAGEFVDFCELLHAVEVEGGEEAPLYIPVGESHQLTLPRKPKKRVITSRLGVCASMGTATLPTDLLMVQTYWHTCIWWPAWSKYLLSLHA